MLYIIHVLCPLQFGDFYIVQLSYPRHFYSHFEALDALDEMKRKYFDGDEMREVEGNYFDW